MEGKNELLRFTTAGSVDDGKSTLIGRLLYDSKSIFEDQLDAVERSSHRKGLNGIDLALFTDGLRDEREQGITIDVAYRYFSTPRRKFIIADTPGHTQYTRNMVTGASTADAALILIDARNGVIEQTRRHAYIASLLRIPHVVVCVNKMDLVNYDRGVFQEVSREFEGLSERLNLNQVTFVPISALNGDNVVNPSRNMPWFGGVPLLELLETLPVDASQDSSALRLPVQTVIRPQGGDFRDYRGYAGRIASGGIRVGEEVLILPTGTRSVVKSITSRGKYVEDAHAPMSVSIELEDDFDISRGDMIAGVASPPRATQDLEVMMCWLNPEPMRSGSRYFLRHTTAEHKAVVKEVCHRVDVNSLEHVEDTAPLGMNEIARVRLRSAQPVFVDSYARDRSGGSLILVDEATNETVAAAMVV